MTTVYAVFERIYGDPDHPATLSKLYTDQEAAWRWVAIMEDEAVSLHMAGKTPFRYIYTVEPWDLHEQ